MANGVERTYRINVAEVQRLRAARPVSDAKLATQAGNVHVKTLRKWLSGKQPAYLRHIEALARALGCGDDYTRTVLSNNDSFDGSGARHPTPADVNGGVVAQDHHRDPQGKKPLRLFNLPSPLRNLVGRRDLIHELGRSLRGEGCAAGRVCLRGMGGIGKTTLAVRVAHDVGETFPDGQLFIDLAGQSTQPLSADEAMTRVIWELKPDYAPLGSGHDLGAVYRAALAGRRVVLVLDDAESATQVRPLLTAAESIGFIITSRNTLALDEVASISLDLLTAGEASSLLRTIIGNVGTASEVDRLVELCGRLPLALRVAGDFLRLRSDWRIAQYIAALESERLGWLKVGVDTGKDVDVVLRHSATHLLQRSLKLAIRWHLLHIFVRNFGLAAVAAVWGDDPNDPRVRSDLSDLENRSLISYDAANNCYFLHDLIRPIAATLFESGRGRESGHRIGVDRLEKKRRNARVRLAHHYLELFQQFARGHVFDGEELEDSCNLYDIDLDTLDHLCEWVKQNAALNHIVSALDAEFAHIRHALYLLRGIGPNTLRKGPLNLTLEGLVVLEKHEPWWFHDHRPVNRDYVENEGGPDDMQADNIVS